MEQLATSVRPLRIAIIGAGPAGFYAAETLLKKRESLFCHNGQFVCHPDGLSLFQHVVGM